MDLEEAHYVEVKFGTDKHIMGKLEYFTSLGLHQETGKTLKTITKYMINEYICDKASNN